MTEKGTAIPTVTSEPCSTAFPPVGRITQGTAPEATRSRSGCWNRPRLTPRAIPCVHTAAHFASQFGIVEQRYVVGHVRLPRKGPIVRKAQNMVHGESVTCASTIR